MINDERQAPQTVANGGLHFRESLIAIRVTCAMEIQAQYDYIVSLVHLFLIVSRLMRCDRTDDDFSFFTPKMVHRYGKVGDESDAHSQCAESVNKLINLSTLRLSGEPSSEMKPIINSIMMIIQTLHTLAASPPPSSSILNCRLWRLIICGGHLSTAPKNDMHNFI